MTVRYPVALRNTRLQAIVTAAGADAQILLYTGTRPANGGAVTGGNTLVAELVADDTAFASVDAGVLTANSITRDNEANNNGTPTFARILTSGSDWVADIATPGFPACTQGEPVEISALTITDSNFDA